MTHCEVFGNVLYVIRYQRGMLGNICANILGVKQDFCFNISDAKQDFCSNILDAKEDFCSNILGAKQDFCSNILGAKQGVNPPFHLRMVYLLSVEYFHNLALQYGNRCRHCQDGL